MSINENWMGKALTLLTATAGEEYFSRLFPFFCNLYASRIPPRFRGA